MDYQRPTLTELGSVRELTLAGDAGTRLDAEFPAGTPISDFTLSG